MSHQFPKSDPWLGQVVEGFRLEEGLAIGGTAKAYLASYQGALHEDTVPLRIVKVLLSQHHHHPGMLALFRREARIHKKLEHPNIARLESYGEQENLGSYMLMERLEGESLSQHLRGLNGLVPNASISLWMKKLCETLGYLHSQKIIHRDLKPENIFLPAEHQPKEAIKLIDFGIAYDPSEDELATRKAGTARYMSPEQVLGKEATLHTDLYSLGVILFELLTRQALFVRMNSKERKRAHLEEEPPKLKESRSDLIFPDGLEEFLLKALEKDPANRPQSAFAFFEQLRPLLKEPVLRSGRRKKAILLSNSMKQMGWKAPVEQASFKNASEVAGSNVLVGNSESLEAEDLEYLLEMSNQETPSPELSHLHQVSSAETMDNPVFSDKLMSSSAQAVVKLDSFAKSDLSESPKVTPKLSTGLAMEFRTSLSSNSLKDPLTFSSAQIHEKKPLVKKAYKSENQYDEKKPLVEKPYEPEKRQAPMLVKKSINLELSKSYLPIAVFLLLCVSVILLLGWFFFY